MSDSSSIVGMVKLRSEGESVPDRGLTVSKLRVELAEEEESNFAWIAELIVVGDLPWRKGEERRVELRVMSEEFSTQLERKQVSLVVKRGGEIIGHLRFEK